MQVGVQRSGVSANQRHALRGATTRPARMTTSASFVAENTSKVPEAQSRLRCKRHFFRYSWVPANLFLRRKNICPAKYPSNMTPVSAHERRLQSVTANNSVTTAKAHMKLSPTNA